MAAKQNENIGVRALARETGYSPGIICRKMKQGKSADEIRLEAIAWQEKLAKKGGKAEVRATPAAVRVTPEPEPMRRPSRDETYSEAQRRKESAQADLKELEARKRTGELIEVAIVEQQWTEMSTAIRDAILGMPLKLSGRLAAMTNQREIETFLKERFRAELGKISETLAGTNEAAA